MTNLPPNRSTPFLHFAVAETLLNDNWLVIPQNFSEHLISWDNNPASAAIGSQARPPRWDAIMLNGEEAAIGCAQGWLSPINQNSCGKPAGYLHSTLIWHKKRFATPPDWTALWDVVRHPGKRGFPRQARGTLEFTLLAYQIPPTEIYNTLSTPEGQKLAFELLNRIRPFIAWYRTPDEFQALMRDKHMIIGIAPLSALTFTHPLEIDPAFIPNFADSIYSKRFWTIPSSLSASEHAHIAKILNESAPHLFYETPDITDTSLIVDDKFWMTYAPVLEPAFKKWLKTGVLDIKAISH